MLAGFLSEQPHVVLELFVSDEPLDIVAEANDAGIRLGSAIDREMIAAVSVSGDLRLVVGAVRCGCACSSTSSSPPR